MFTDADVISRYSRAQAIADGVLVDATVGELADVTGQHFPGLMYPGGVAMTPPVAELIRCAVDNPNWLNDWRGVWHDVCFMSRPAVLRLCDADGGGPSPFRVIITGTGRRRYHTLYVALDGGDDGRGALTYMVDPSEA